MATREFRFYEKTQIVCPECLQLLIWCKRVDVKDSMQLRHSPHATCSRSKKFFYPPVLHLAEYET